MFEYKYVSGTFKQTANFNTPWVTGTNEISVVSEQDAFVANFRALRAVMSVKQGTTAVAHQGSYQFGGVVVGTNSGDITFTVENTGYSDLNLSALQIVGTHASEFSATGFVNTSIAPNGNTTFQLKFTPAAGGTRTAFITIPNNDPKKNPFTFTVTGSGSVATLAVKNNGVLIPRPTGEYNFGNVTFGTKGGVTLSLENVGGTALNLGNIQIGGTDAAMFAQAGLSTFSLPPLANTSLNLIFDGNNAGNKTAILSIGSKRSYTKPV